MWMWWNENQLWEGLGQQDPRGLFQPQPDWASLWLHATRTDFFFFLNSLFSSCFSVIKAILCCFPALMEDRLLLSSSSCGKSSLPFYCLSVMAVQVSRFFISFPPGLLLSVTPTWFGWASHVSSYTFLESMNSHSWDQLPSLSSESKTGYWFLFAGELISIGRVVQVINFGCSKFPVQSGVSFSPCCRLSGRALCFSGCWAVMQLHL